MLRVTTLLKKIFTILLLGCLCLNVTGYYVVFQFRKATLKIAMKRMLRRQVYNQDEVIFNFPLHTTHGHDSPEWENENEFELRGKMYDVIDKKIVNGMLVVRCISDEKETELINKWQELLEKQQEGRTKKRSASLIKLITSLFTLPSILTYSSGLVDLRKQFPALDCSIPLVCREVITPPPRFL